MKKRVEHLFPELCNIFGEGYNMEYLRRCNEDIEILETNHRDEPAFVSQDVDMVYLGCAPERKQEQIIQILKAHRARIEELIERGTIFLATGNAIEVFGKEIVDEGRRIEALGLFDFSATRYMDRDRHNSQYVGEFTGNDGSAFTMLGHRSQFSFAYGNFTEPLLKVDIGIGMNPETKLEGLHRGDLYATYSLGPCFIMNPPFCKYILRRLGLDDALVFEQEAMEAYEYRKAELIRNLG